MSEEATITLKIKRFKQCLASFVASLGGFSLGVCLGWYSSGGETMMNHGNVDVTEIGIVGGIFNLGVCIGLTILPFILRRFSRIVTMMYIIPITFIGWSFIVFAGNTHVAKKISLLGPLKINLHPKANFFNVNKLQVNCLHKLLPLMILGRILCGFSGSFCVLVPIYIAEISDKKIRGSLLCVFQLFINMGIMFAYWIGHLTVDENTVWLYSLVCAVTAAPVAIVIIMPESPVYHMILGNEERAKLSLEYFRGKHYDGLEAEIVELKSLVALKKSNQVTLRTILKDKTVIRSLCTSFAVMMMYQFSGISPFVFYTLLIFKHGGSPGIDETGQTMIVGGAQIVGSVIAIILVDIIGRKPLIILSTSLMGVFMILLGWYSQTEEADPEYADSLSWMPLTWITLFFASFNLGVGPIAWVYIGEIFPIQVRIEAACAMAFINWILGLILTLSFGLILEGLGLAKTVYFLGVMTWAGTIFAAIFIRETKRKSLMELQGVNFVDETQ